MTTSRRTVLKSLTASAACTFLDADAIAGRDPEIQVAGRPVVLSVTAAGPRIVRISLVPIAAGSPQRIPSDGSLVEREWAEPSARLTALSTPRSFPCGGARVTVSAEPLTIRVDDADGRLVQQIRFDAKAGSFVFHLGDGPVLGLGEGGPQFDRRGSVDRMRSGQGGYRLSTHGGRVPVPWLIGTAGWAMLVHQPYGTFDLTGSEGRFRPVREDSAAARPVRRDRARSGPGDGRLRAADWLAGDAAPLDVGLSAIASHARRS